MDSKHLKILFMTENNVYAEYVNKMLKKSENNQFIVVNVDNFIDAYEKLNKNHFNVLLIELGLKNQNNLNILKKLYILFPELAILIIANNFDETVINALEYGAQDFLIKREFYTKNLEQSLIYAFKKKERNLNLDKIADERIADERIVDDGKIIEYLADTLHELQVHHIELEIQNEELRKTWEELEQSRMKYQDLYDNAPITILSINESGLIINANLTSSEMFNIERKKLINQAFILFLGHESRRKFHKHLNKIFETKTRQYCQLRIIRKDGTTFNAALETTPILNENRYSELRIAILDITEQKKAEQAILRLATLVQSSTHGIIEIDLNGNIKSWNSGATKIYGYSEEEIIGKSIFKLVPIEYNNEIKKLEENIKSGKSVNNLETIRITKDNQKINISVTVTPITDKLGKIIGASAIFHDISEKKKTEIELDKYRKNLEEEVKERTEKLETANKTLITVIGEHEKAEIKLGKLVNELKRSNKDLQQFAYVASHDLQEPLRMVSSFTQLLKRQYKDKLDEDANEYIMYAVDGAKRMQLLINDLLEYSRVTTQGEQFTQVNIEEVLEQVLFDLEISIEEEGAVVNKGKMPRICADQSQMIQIFQNLIANALKYHSEKAPIIDISAKEEEDKWVFRVSDNGIGIDPEYHQRIFQIFQRLHEIHIYSGTGIGLAICKKIVERHGGQIWVDSKLGKGSNFYFSIPKKVKTS